LLGRITVGDHCLIGANAVVVRDVPAYSVAVGVPAVVRPRRRGAT
jgi:serine O-acetyltransferase